MSDRIIDCPARVIVIELDWDDAAGPVAPATTNRIAKPIVLAVNPPDFHGVRTI
jgi:hypothetical protein